MTQRLDGWSERLTRTIAAEVRRYREDRGLSAQQFADACTAVGLPMKRSVIANFENGRRASVGVDELLVFARVLNVPPIYLMVPVGRVEWAEMQPGMESDPYRVAMWITGEVPFDGSEERIWPAPLPKFRRIMQELIHLREVTEDLEVARLGYEELGMTVEEAERATEQAMQAATHASNVVDEAVVASIRGRDSNDAAKREEVDMRQMDAMESLRQAQLLAEMASTKHVSVISRYRQVEVCQRKQERIEDAIRRDLVELRAGGWEIPVIPAEFHYLLESVKSERRRPERG